MGFIITTLNSLQKQIGTPLNSSSNTIGAVATVIYTVPAGKKAIINTFLDRVIGYGTGTLVTFSAGQAIRTKTGAGVPELVFTNENLQGLTLTAGQTITVVSDAAGNNASAAWIINVTELPA